MHIRPRAAGCQRSGSTLTVRGRLAEHAGMRKHGLLLVTLLVGTSLVYAKGPDIEARLARQNALFEEQYESDLRAHPETATAYGDYRYNDQLNDYSLAGAKDQQAR